MKKFFVYKRKLSLSHALLYLVDLFINKLKTKFNNLFYRMILNTKRIHNSYGRNFHARAKQMPSKVLFVGNKESEVASVNINHQPPPLQWITVIYLGTVGGGNRGPSLQPPVSCIPSFWPFYLGFLPLDLFLIAKIILTSTSPASHPFRTPTSPPFLFCLLTQHPPPHLLSSPSFLWSLYKCKPLPLPVFTKCVN